MGDGMYLIVVTTTGSLIDDVQEKENASLGLLALPYMPRPICEVISESVALVYSLLRAPVHPLRRSTQVPHQNLYQFSEKRPGGYAPSA